MTQPMKQPIVVIGGGLAAGTAVGALRLSGYDGPLVLFTDEPRAPYERPPLSKAYLMGKDPAEKAFVHPPEWYAEHDVDLRTETRVESIDLAQQTVRAGQDDLAYDQLLIATGARPRHLEMVDASGVPTTYLRTLDDSTHLREKLQPGKRIAIIGGGWIGLEVASAAREAGCEVVVLEALELPLGRVLGPEVATVFADLHRDHGVDLRTSVTVEAIERRRRRGGAHARRRQHCDLRPPGRRRRRDPRRRARRGCRARSRQRHQDRRPPADLRPARVRRW